MTSSREILLLIGREIGRCVEAVDSHQLDAVVEAIDGAPRVFLAGAGRSGLAMRACAMRLMHLGKAVHVVSAFAAENHLILGQLSTDEKSNEITAIPLLLNMLDT